jgi:hypothetical protein
MNETTKLILEITFNEESGNYNLKAGKGMSVNEVMFGVAALIKCLVRDGVVEDKNAPVEMLNRYLNDPQYDELKEEPNEQEQL